MARCLTKPPLTINYMAGYERLKTRGTAGFKRKVSTNGYMATMSQGQRDAWQDARLNAYVSEVERESIRKNGIRKLKFIGRNTGLGKKVA